MMLTGMTSPEGPSAPSGFHELRRRREPEHLGLVDILDRVEAAVHVAIERGVADRHFRLVAGGHHHRAGLVGDRHQQRAAGARLQVLFGDVARQPLERPGQDLLKAIHRLRDRQHLVADAERRGELGGVIERHLRGEAERQHHAADAVRAQAHRPRSPRTAPNRCRRRCRAARPESRSCRHSRAGRARRRRSRPCRPRAAAPPVRCSASRHRPCSSARS